MQGVMAIPSLFLFHNGKAAARYNETDYKVDLFAAFITRYTGMIKIGAFSVPISWGTYIFFVQAFHQWEY